MPRTVKTYTIADRRYVVNQMNAVDGSMFFQKHQMMIVEMMQAYGDILVRWKRNKYLHQSGWSRALAVLTDYICASVDKKGLTSEEIATKEENALQEFIDNLLSLVTVDGEAVTLNDSFNGRLEELAFLVVNVFDHNFSKVWPERFRIPPEYDFGESTPRNLESVVGSYSQSGILYTVLNTAGLATYAELITVLNTADLYDLYETASRKIYETSEYQKQAQREAEQSR